MRCLAFGWLQARCNACANSIEKLRLLNSVVGLWPHRNDKHQHNCPKRKLHSLSNIHSLQWCCCINCGNKNTIIRYIAFTHEVNRFFFFYHPTDDWSLYQTIIGRSTIFSKTILPPVIRKTILCVIKSRDYPISFEMTIILFERPKQNGSTIKETWWGWNEPFNFIDATISVWNYWNGVWQPKLINLISIALYNMRSRRVHSSALAPGNMGIVHCFIPSISWMTPMRHHMSHRLSYIRNVHCFRTIKKMQLILVASPHAKWLLLKCDPKWNKHHYLYHSDKMESEKLCFLLSIQRQSAGAFTEIHFIENISHLNWTINCTIVAHLTDIMQFWHSIWQLIRTLIPSDCVLVFFFFIFLQMVAIFFFSIKCNDVFGDENRKFFIWS